ncbi:MAG TPA: threonine synthase [Candidatus Paceibacterota bacterium]
MLYISTRGEAKPKSFTEILLEGLASDGGLYVPEIYPQFSSAELLAMRGMDYRKLAVTILSKFMDDIPGDVLRKMINETYTKEVFGSDDITPLKKLEPDFFILGLAEGPTLAFKDIALQFIGRLFEYALEKAGHELNILGATSGDTGSAAEVAMRGRSAIRVFMLSPYGRMSDFQRKQMYTIHDANIFNISIKGTFDDCQDIVKKLNEDAEFKKRFNIGAVNSINWARIAVQTVYYFYGYFRATNSNTEQVSFSIPTGNFGNILAGFIARKMGLPIRRLILATNENNVLEEFFRTGIYRPRKGAEVAVTSSPSMDISKASNFERYIFELSGRKPNRVKQLWADLVSKDFFDISGSEDFSNIKDTGIVADSSSHKDRIATIKHVYEKYSVLIDPHTADGAKVALSYREAGVPLLCMETALPAKFAETIREAIGKDPAYPENKPIPEDLDEKFEIMKADEEEVKKFIASRAD